MSVAIAVQRGSAMAYLEGYDRALTALGKLSTVTLSMEKEQEEEEKGENAGVDSVGQGDEEEEDEGDGLGESRAA